MHEKIIDVPPLLIRGSVCPVTGNIPTFTPILITAWNKNANDNEATIKEPKTLSVFW